MRKCALLGLLTVSLFAALPAAGQETVLGFFEGPTSCDGLPTTCNSGSGVIPLTGWAVADSGVSRVIIQVNGFDVAQASYGSVRPLVEAEFPGFPDSSGPGFGYKLNSTVYLNGLNSVSAKIETFAGTVGVVPVNVPGNLLAVGHPGGGRVLNFTNNTSILVPFGEIERPLRNATLFGTCDLLNPLRRFAVISGWALDLGVEIGDAGIGWVELLIDGVIVANTRTDCRFDLAAGGFTDCYGLPRLDIERQYPFALDAPNAGYRFALDVGVLLNSGRAEGHHTLTIRAGDISNQTANVDELPVFLACSDSAGFNEASFGQITVPNQGRIFTGLMNFVGWALDGEGVASVEVFIDGSSIGFANFPAPDFLPAVAEEFPGFPDTNAPVWRLSNFDSTQLSDGLHQVQVQVTDLAGEQTIIGERTFLIVNP